MAQDNHDTDPVLAAIEAKIAAWTAVLETYKAARAIDGPASDAATVMSAKGTASATVTVRGHGRAITDLPVGVFRDKTIRDAIVILLEAGRRKQTNKEIADGLKKGGIATTSANFEPTVATALYRLKNDGIVLRFDDGWDLAKSYPDSLRSRMEKVAAPAKKKGKAKSRSSRRPQQPKLLPASGAEPA